MNTAQKIAKNSLILVTAEALGMLISLFFTIIVARKLGVPAFGKYTFALGFISLFLFLFNCGLDTLATREVTRRRAEVSRYYQNFLSIKFLSSLLAFFLIVGAVTFLHTSREIILLVTFLGLSKFFGTSIEFNSAFFRAFEEMEYEAILKLTNRVQNFLLGVGILCLGYGLLSLSLMLLLSSFISFVLGTFFVTRKYSPFKLKLDWPFCKRNMKEAFPLAMASAFIVVYFSIDIVMLSVMQGDVAVGYYGATTKLMAGLMIVPASVMTAVKPKLSRLYEESKDKMAKLYNLCFKFFFALGLPLAVGITVLAERFIRIIYGIEYMPSVIALQILAWAVLIIYLNTVVDHTVIALNKQKIWLYMSATSVILNIGLNLILIPLYSFKGAAIATVLTELYGFLFVSRFVAKELGSVQFIDHMGRPAIAALIMGSFLFCLRNQSLLLLIPGAMAIYLGLLYRIQWVSMEERDIFKSLFLPYQKWLH